MVNALPVEASSMIMLPVCSPNATNLSSGEKIGVDIGAPVSRIENNCTPVVAFHIFRVLPDRLSTFLPSKESFTSSAAGPYLPGLSSCIAIN